MSDLMSLAKCWEKCAAGADEWAAESKERAEQEKAQVVRSVFKLCAAMLRLELMSMKATDDEEWDASELIGKVGKPI